MPFCQSTNRQKQMSEDTKHDWVWNLHKGDKAWVAVEENIASNGRYDIEFLEQTGPAEWEQTDEIFVPHEMIVSNKWVLHGSDGDSHIISLAEFARLPQYGRNFYVVDAKERDLQDLFTSRRCEDMVIPAHVFRTEEECRSFCNSTLLMSYSVGRCNELISALYGIIERVKSVRKICAEEEGGEAV